jgi:uncharacterized protein (TIGR00251 family)
MSALSEGGFAVREVVGGVQFALRVQPGAKREGVVGLYGDAVKIALSAPAVDGKANEALVWFVAEALRVSRASVEIVSGSTSRSKVMRVLGVTADEVLVAFSVQQAS